MSREVSQALYDWVTGKFKDSMSIFTIDERKAVVEGVIDIDSKLDSMCAG